MKRESDARELVQDNLRKKKQETWVPASKPIAHDGHDSKDTLKHLLSKMDDQFREIKETLYFRRIRQSIELDKPSSSISTTPPASEHETNIRQAVAKTGETQVYPVSNIQADDVDLVHIQGPVSNRPTSKVSLWASKAFASFNRQRETRKEPNHISDLYREQLRKISADTFSEQTFASKRCFFFRRDLELDKFCRDSLWTVCTPIIYFWLLITGIIPTRYVPWLIPLVWCAIIVLKIWFLADAIYGLVMDTLCNAVFKNCISVSFGLTYNGSKILYNVFHVLCLCSNLFVVAPLVQSKELRYLLTYVGLSRVRGSKISNILLLVVCILFLILSTVYAIIRGLNGGMSVLVCFSLAISVISAAGAYSTTFVFWIMYNTLQTCYADFAVDVLECSGHALQLYTPGGNPEIVLMNQLKRIVSLSATLTERARIALLLPLISGFLYVFWVVFSKWTLTIYLHVIFGAAGELIIPAFAPAILALWTTLAGSMLDRLVTLSSFLNLATFVQNNPTEWMLTLRMSVSSGLLAKLTTAVVALGVVGNILDSRGNAVFESALWMPEHYASGSCSDGQWSGLEQHVDCGGPSSGCASTCVKKYGDYILIEATRDCSDIDGYVEIRTQRACEIAFASFERTRTNASMLTRVPAAVILSTDDTSFSNMSLSGLRCGSRGRDGHEVRQVDFPVLIAAAPLQSAVSLVAAWPTLYRQDTHFAPGVLCMARERTCSFKDANRWHEAMTCLSETPSPVNASWTVLSQPWVNDTYTNYMDPVAQMISRKRMLVKAQGDCAQVKLHSFGARYGGHVVLEIACTPEDRCDFTPRVQAQDCSRVSGLLSVSNNTRREENERHDLNALCGSSQELKIDAVSGDYVHIIADARTGPFEIDLCV